MESLFGNPVIDESTTSAHWHTYSAFLNSFSKTDIIRVQFQKLMVYDNNRNVGITSCLKNYISLNKSESKALINGSWSPEQSIEPKTLSDDNSLLCSDANEKPKIQLTKVQWRVQHINLTDALKLNLYSNITNNAKIMLAFRNLELYEYPSFPQNTNHQIWNVKTTAQLEKPRFIIFALLTDKLNQFTKDPSKFDHCNITDLKVYLNSECYPYEDITLLFERNRYGVAYDAYTRFRSSYYNYPVAEPLLTLKEFKQKATILIIDTRYQNENLKMGPVDVRVELKTSEMISANTIAYCLMLHDRLVEFTSLSGEVVKII
ncbi:uncharacterized protein LOC129614905 [Condylostylus longicornis]|uniref:uncharacterized protein LOC129614905 n=1 Tax=Condylostylus longicornis TaxID=2530218 RepID=UPI00244E3A64|nr:uncharacterized protein LOC129614905 [Condylostylus longicornis]